MPRLAEFEGITISVYANDHAPPHIHAYYGDDAVLLVISTGAVYAGSIPQKKLRAAQAWLKANRKYAQKKWDEFNP